MIVCSRVIIVTDICSQCVLVTEHEVLRYLCRLYRLAVQKNPGNSLCKFSLDSLVAILSSLLRQSLHGDEDSRACVQSSSAIIRSPFAFPPKALDDNCQLIFNDNCHLIINNHNCHDEQQLRIFVRDMRKGKFSWIDRVIWWNMNEPEIWLKLP